MKTFKKQLVKVTIGVVLASTLLTSLPVLAATDRKPSQTRFTQWEKTTLEEANNEIPRGDFKIKEQKGFQGTMGNRSRSGSWSWRDGVICITDSYAKSPLFNNGHAGIVAPAPYYDSTIEANPTDGVQPKYGNWESRFPGSRVYQYGVKRTSIRQDQKASEWAARQIGKQYNGELFNIARRDKFYCSHLVWAAYKDVTGVDIGTWAWGHAIHPFELMDSGETDLIFRN